MSGWQWFWTVVGFILFIIVLIFLYYYAPFEQLFVLVLNGISFSNVIFRVALVVGIVGFCVFHWHAYRLHVSRQHSVDVMVLSSLRGSTFIAVLLSGGATLQSLQILCVYLLGGGDLVDAEVREAARRGGRAGGADRALLRDLLAVEGGSFGDPDRLSPAPPRGRRFQASEDRSRAGTDRKLVEHVAGAGGRWSRPAGSNR